MKCASTGDRVTVHYIGTLDNGQVFDHRDDDQPLVFALGAGEVFSALEQGVIGMAVGEVKNSHLTAAQAFGLLRDENLLNVSRAVFPEHRELRIGHKLSVELDVTPPQVMRVRQIGGQTVLLDGNHDLAGCDLTFALALVSIA